MPTTKPTMVIHGHGPVNLSAPLLAVHGAGGDVLLAVTRDGQISGTLEGAREAGRIFAESVRDHLIVMGGGVPAPITVPTSDPRPAGTV